MNFDDFSIVSFSLSDFSGLLSLCGVGVVYVFFWVSEDGTLIPFYVGETDVLPARVGDYCRAGFSASTDFKVGEAAKYLNDVKQRRIVLKYKRSSDKKDERCKEEDAIADKLRSEGARLLNDFRGYKYATTSEDKERDAIWRFCDMLIQSHSSLTLQNVRSNPIRRR
jgi:hypothetical protein